MDDVFDSFTKKNNTSSTTFKPQEDDVFSQTIEKTSPVAKKKVNINAIRELGLSQGMRSDERKEKHERITISVFNKDLRIIEEAIAQYKQSGISKSKASSSSVVRAALSWFDDQPAEIKARLIADNMSWGK